MGSRAVTFAVLGVLIVVAGILVGVTVKGERPEPVEAEATAAAVPSVEEAKEVVCAVCAGKHPKDEMYLAAVESLGYAPDSMPVMVCSEVCGQRALGDPEKHRKASISELAKSAAE